MQCIHSGAVYHSVLFLLYALESQSIYFLWNPIHWPAQSQVWHPNLFLAWPWGQSLVQPGWAHTSTRKKHIRFLFDTQIHMGYWPRLCGQDDWILTSFFMFMEQRRSQIFYWQAWSIKDVLHRKKLKHSLFSCGIQRVIPNGQDSSILLCLEHYSVPVNEN